MNGEKLKADFTSPSASYRTAPLWIWNDDMNEQIIRNQLEALHENGFGGAFVHPRPGMITTYLTDEWFKLWEYALNVAKELNVKLYMYDENTYPSGYGGGHVTSELPDLWATGVALRKVSANSRRHFHGSGRYYELVKAYSYEENDDGTIRLSADLTDLPKSEWTKHGDQFAIFELTVPQPLPWLAGFAYPDILRPEVTQRFIECSYEPYKERFAEDFGDTIPAVFTDEPRIAARNLWQQGIESTAFSYWLNMQFEQINGYSLTDHLPCLFFDSCEGDFSVDPLKVRYDYYNTLRHLWIKNFIKPLSDWCRKNDLNFTGHFLEHSWPHAKSSPAIMSLYEYMDWPGIDMLNSYMLKNDGKHPLLLTIREAHSAANQFGKSRVICETYGAGGWDASFEDFKRIGDWLFANGVNFISQHLTFSTIAGARKRDHPPSFDWRQPWWDEFKQLNDYQARVSYAVSQGKTEHRILLLHPTTTAFLESAGPSHASMLKGHIPKHPDMSEYIDLIQQLADGQFDYDLGEEFIIERHGKVEANTLKVAQGQYDVVVVSGCMKNMKASTAALLKSFMDAGGTVLSLKAEPFRIDAAHDERAEQLLTHPRWRNVAQWSELKRALAELVPPRVSMLEHDTLPAGFHHLRKNLGEGKALYFITNASPDAVKGTLKLTGRHAEQWNPWTGEIFAADYHPVLNHELSIPIALEPSESVIIVTYDQAASGMAASGKIDVSAADSVLATDKTTTSRSNGQMRGKRLKTYEEDRSKWSVTPDRSNVLVLDRCDLTVGTKQYDDLPVLQAQAKVFKHHGFNTNPWADSVQYKERLLERNREFGEGTGYEAQYRFMIAPDVDLAATNMYVVLEWPEFAVVHINGERLNEDYRVSKMDHRFGEWDIADHIRHGENVVTVVVKPFQLFSELESVYIRGDFTVRPVEGKWTICPKAAAAISLGSWKTHGYPFYDGSFTYRTSFNVDTPAKKIVLNVPDWNGSVAKITINGNELGLLGSGNGQKNVIDVTEHVQQGGNEVEMKICGSLKNVFGPHFDPKRPRNTAWPGMWSHFPKQAVHADAYDLIDYGLFESIKLEAWE